jgi:hypothetical protein
MTTERFAYQHEVGDRFPGKILEVGINDDPGGNKGHFGDRLTTADRYEWDGALDYPIYADFYFDAGKDTWPFQDDEFELVMMAEVTEHLLPDEAAHAYTEARRVGKNLLITVPQDPRFMDEPEEADKPGSHHVNYCTEDYLRGLFKRTGWAVSEWHEKDYGWWAETGFFILAERAPVKKPRTKSQPKTK